MMPVPFRAEISTTGQPSWRDELLDVDLVAVLLDDVHHVDGHDHRDAELGQLRGEVEVPLQVRAVDDVQNRVGTLA